MSSFERMVIVGAGLAGARAAEALRKEGFDGTLTLIGDEPERPYLRPPLSKEFLRAEVDRDHLYVHPDSFYRDNAINLRVSTPVRSIDAGTRDVVLDDGSRVGFDRLLIATGARPRQVDVAGADLPGVVSLRTVRDSEALSVAALSSERIVVVGGGWIGSEIAASLRMLGRSVVLITPDEAPLTRVLGPEVGRVYRDLHLEHGVDLRSQSRVVRIHGRDRVESVETTTGDRIPADLVVLGVGVEPRTELGVSAGAAVGDGIQVSASLETSVPGIYAAGDVASAWHPFYQRRIRSEHWATARFQGTAVARSMLGTGADYDRIPYAYSDQYDLSMEFTGTARSSDRLVVRGSLEERTFVAFWLSDGRVTGGMNANVAKVAKGIERLIRSRTVVDEHALADPSVPLEELTELERAA